jgi:hypothetical protein
MLAFIQAWVGHAGCPLLPQAKVFGPDAALPAAEAGWVLPPADAAAAGSLAGSVALSTGAGAATDAAAGAGTADAAALAGAAVVLGSVFEHPEAIAQNKAPMHTARRSFIFFLSASIL